MALRLWDDAYSIGIAEIDQQHKELFGRMLTLHRAILAGKTAAELEPTFLELIRESEAHFRTEETLMAFHRFPDLRNHQCEHHLISGQVRAFLAEYEAKKPGLIVDILEYVEDCQSIHVLQHDMKYRDYLMQQWGIQLRGGKSIDTDQVLRLNRDGRRFARLSCSIPVQLTSTIDTPVVYANCVNISRAGAFLKTWSPLGLNTAATARFQIADSTVEVRVAVRRSEPCVGMGITFLSPLPEKLERFVEDLLQAQTPQSDPTEITCERLLHNCMQNFGALEDVICESEITASTAAAVHALFIRAQRLERLTSETAPYQLCSQLELKSGKTHSL